MIGPVYPYKGGIAHYTGLMCKALRKKYDVTMVSFQMQYPKFLYKKEQKDYDNPQFEVPETKYWIHTANPFNIVKASKWILKEKPDLGDLPMVASVLCTVFLDHGKNVEKAYEDHVFMS